MHDRGADYTLLYDSGFIFYRKRHTLLHAFYTGCVAADYFCQRQEEDEPYSYDNKHFSFCSGFHCTVCDTGYIRTVFIAQQGRVSGHTVQADRLGLIDYLSEVNPDVATNEVWLSVTDEILSDIFNLFVWFAPAILAFVALAYAWMTTAVYRFFAVVRQDETTRDYSAWNITMSGVSAVVFLAAILCSFLSSYSDVDVFYVVSSNIAYILMPGFVYFGLKHSSVFWSFLCIFIMFWSFTGAITLLSLSGAFAAITISFRNRQKT